MRSETPQELHSLFVAAFNSGDLDALLALYEPNAALATQSGLTQVGTEKLGDSFRTVIGMKGTMSIDTAYAIEADGIALLRGAWSLESLTPVGKPVTMKGHSIEVARRQQDGSWLFVIDHPFGAM
jgi:ketosteroid isomerase-like protein